ncbi:putative transposase [Streptosporangium lutulentum]|uniref:Transposase n=1 Tax=Streptosporangium lutulentum TaxID=1461250 RepID=A0ABT9QCD7_9ACTN|nr:putative transposase [Streptosporangium lutulentum]
MRRSFKFLLRPTTHQQTALTACLDDHRDLYNAALEHRRTAYRKAGVSVRYADQSAELKDIRAADPNGQGRWSAGSQQQTLRRLDRAFAAFFHRIKAGQTPGYPRFKGRGRFDTIEWPATKNGATWDSTPHDPTATRLRLLGIGHLRVHQHRTVRGTVKTISVKREGTRWYVILSCDDVPAEPLPATGRQAGFDMGIVHFTTASEPIEGVTDGQGHVANPRYLKTAADRIAAAQRVYARTRRGSKRRTKAARQIGRLHRKVARQRADHAHKTALAVVRACDVIAVEDLRIANMTKAPAPRPDPERTGAYLRNGSAAKAGLTTSIVDAGWGVFLTILASKAESAGREVIAVNPANTSRTCPAPGCGHLARENRLTQADFVCVVCGYTANADVVGALNVKRIGLVLRDTREG